jgi:hypothetical protein
MKRIRRILAGAAALIVAGVVFLLPALFIWGGLFLAAAALPWLSVAAGIQFWITLLVLVPLAFLPATRLFAGKGIRFFSYLFGLTVWLWGLAATYFFWGVIPVFVGLFVFGIGVVPLGALAFILEGMWSPALQLLGAVIMVFVTRLLGHWLVAKAEADSVADEILDMAVERVRADRASKGLPQDARSDDELKESYRRTWSQELRREQP